MSVLIKGMEMPKNCLNCPMLGVLFNCRVVGNGEMEDNITVRRADCPLIEIPPHGRLIDANEIIIPFFENIDDENLMRKVIKAMPTIIPADGGE